MLPLCPLQTTPALGAENQSENQTGMGGAMGGAVPGAVKQQLRKIHGAHLLGELGSIRGNLQPRLLAAVL